MNDDSLRIQAVLQSAARWNRQGVEQVARGRFAKGVVFFRRALAFLCSSSETTKCSFEVDEDDDVQDHQKDDYGGGGVDVDDDDHFLFKCPLEFNVALPEDGATTSNTQIATIFHAAVQLNLSIAWHRQGLATGSTLAVKRAKESYQATLSNLQEIDRGGPSVPITPSCTAAWLIGIYAFQNLAILHYTEMEFPESQHCLYILSFLVAHHNQQQSLCGPSLKQQQHQQTSTTDYAAPLLDSKVLAKVCMAMLFFSQVPSTAPSA